MNCKIQFRIIDKEHSEDINIPNQPFSVFGKMIPEYKNEKWSYRTEHFTAPFNMCFPDESYNYDELCKNHIFIGAYDGDKCVGLAIYRHSMFRYLYLYDLKVNREYRRNSIGIGLTRKTSETCHSLGCKGIYTQAQDNNLAARRFCLDNGFVIGGIDTIVYKGTVQ